jgi:predicted nucleic acid-binding protein
MTTEVFIDTCGFFAVLSPHDRDHSAAIQWMISFGELTPIVTTDYILDETVTLLQSRRQQHLIEPWLTNILKSNNCRIEWMNAERFEQVRSFFSKHADKDWSFTDCFSFCVMNERQIEQSLASDRHFQQAGFSALLGA